MYLKNKIHMIVDMAINQQAFFISFCQVGLILLLLFLPRCFSPSKHSLAVFVFMRPPSVPTACCHPLFPPARLGHPYKLHSKCSNPDMRRLMPSERRDSSVVLYIGPLCDNCQPLVPLVCLVVTFRFTFHFFKY